MGSSLFTVGFVSNFNTLFVESLKKLWKQKPFNGWDGNSEISPDLVGNVLFIYLNKMWVRFLLRAVMEEPMEKRRKIINIYLILGLIGVDMIINIDGMEIPQVDIFIINVFVFILLFWWHRSHPMGKEKNLNVFVFILLKKERLTM